MHTGLSIINVHIAHYVVLASVANVRLDVKLQILELQPNSFIHFVIGQRGNSLKAGAGIRYDARVGQHSSVGTC